MILFGAALSAIWWPRLITARVVALVLWLAISLSARAFRLYRQGKKERA